jgi:hypothetical protein
MKSQIDMNDGQASLKDSGHTWFHWQDFPKATRDLEASRATVKGLEARLQVAVEIGEICLRQWDAHMSNFEYSEDQNSPEVQHYNKQKAALEKIKAK